MTTEQTTCPSCRASGGRVFHRQQRIPVHSCLMVASRQEALEFPRGDLALAFCARCGFIWNACFDPAAMRYSADYEETQGYSPTFRRFLENQVKELVERYELRDKDVLEIGCGKGEFLLALCEAGANRGVGLDPGFDAERVGEPARDRIRFIQDFYSEEYTHLAADFVACRHTLEHLPDTLTFMQVVRRSIGDRPATWVFFELPAMERILEERAFWDVYYEHCSYFTLGSLARLFRAAGFEVVELHKDYGDQYLILVSKPAPGPVEHPHAAEEELPELAAAVEAFESDMPARMRALRDELEGLVAEGRRPVLWGSGSKAVSYLNNLQVGAEVEYVVDINPHKHGKFLAGTGQLIVGPEFLREYRPGAVIVMNPIYVEEIAADLARMGLDPIVTALQ